MMSLSIGSLIGYLELNDDKLQATADRADKTLSGLELQLKGLEANRPDLDLETAAAKAKLDELRGRLTELRAQSAEGSDVRVDTVTTMTKIQLVRDQIRALAREAETPKDLDVDIAPAVGKLELLKAQIRSVRDAIYTSVGGASLNPSWLMVGIFGVALPVAIPLLTAAAGLLGAIASGAVAAAAGVGVLKLAFDGVGSSISAYETYQTAMKAATTASQRQAAEYAFKTSAYSTGSPQTQAFTRMYVNRVRPALQATQQTAQKAVLPGVTAGIGAALPVLVAVDGAVAKLGHSLGSMADEAGHALNSPFWKQWFTWLGNDGTKDLQLLGTAGGNFLTALAIGVQRFGPMGAGFLAWLDQVTEHFAKWSAGNGFESFLQTVHTDGDAISHFFSTVGPIILQVLQGMSSTGVVELNVFAAALKTIASIGGAPGLEIIGATLPTILVAAKAAQAIKALAVAMGFFDTAEDANPIGVIVVSLAALVAILIKARDITGSWKGVWEAGLRGAARIFLWFVGLMIEGAEKAFGWVPGLGGKLKNAAAEFTQFSSRVNADLDGITPMKTITINAKVRVPESPTAGPSRLGAIVGQHLAGLGNAANGGTITRHELKITNWETGTGILTTKMRAHAANDRAYIRSK